MKSNVDLFVERFFDALFSTRAMMLRNDFSHYLIFVVVISTLLLLDVVQEEDSSFDMAAHAAIVLFSFLFF
jgi:hypothetical protein